MAIGPDETTVIDPKKKKKYSLDPNTKSTLEFGSSCHHPTTLNIEAVVAGKKRPLHDLKNNTEKTQILRNTREG